MFPDLNKDSCQVQCSGWGAYNKPPPGCRGAVMELSGYGLKPFLLNSALPLFFLQSFVVIIRFTLLIDPFISFDIKNLSNARDMT